MRFAIIGAAMSGLACANTLVAAGHTVRLFDKGRGAGGRMSTRRWDTPLGEVTVDHGAQYFTARHPAFLRLVRDWQEQGIAAIWPPAGPGAWVGVPGMNAVVKQMASSHPISWNTLVTSIVREGDDWRVMSERGEDGPFDAVILAIPAEQAAAMLSLHDFAMTRKALVARSQPCWTGLFVFGQRLESLPVVLRNRGDLAWATRNSDKPGRTKPESWVVQASAGWSSRHLEDQPEQVARLLLDTFSEAAGIRLPQPVAMTANRWRYALSAGTGDGSLWNADLKLGVCGDWLLGPRVECAWLSGQDLASRCLESMAPGEAQVRTAV